MQNGKIADDKQFVWPNSALVGSVVDISPESYNRFKLTRIRTRLHVVFHCRYWQQAVTT